MAKLEIVQSAKATTLIVELAMISYWQVFPCPDDPTQA